MDKYDIERQIMNSIHFPANDLIKGAVLEINSKGYNFIVVDGEIGIWRDEQSGLELNITALLTVSCTEREEDLDIDDEQKRIEDRFYEIGEKGTVKEIQMLALFEGDVSNGGFEQLYDNKGIDFLKESIVTLEAIGSRSKLKLAKEAYEVIRKNMKSIKNYMELQKALLKIDAKYYKSKENIPLLYHRRIGV